MSWSLIENRKFLSGLGYSTSVAIACFAVVRFFEGNYAMVALDLILAAIFFALSLYSQRTGNLVYARYLGAAVAVIGAISTVYFAHSSGPHWIYVSTIALYYLLSLKVATLLSAFILSATVFLLMSRVTIYDLLPMISTVLLVCVFSFLFAYSVSQMERGLKTLSLQDDLTGTGNRRAFGEKLVEVIGRYKRLGHSASLIYLDIDDFKQINDQFGHAAGDEVLKCVSNTLLSTLRQTDSVFRLGGDEFVVISDDAIGSDAMLLAEKVKSMLDSVGNKISPSVSVSIGVAQLLNEDDADGWVARADQALYQAKREGKHQVQLAK